MRDGKRDITPLSDPPSHLTSMVRSSDASASSTNSSSSSGGRRGKHGHDGKGSGFLGFAQQFLPPNIAGRSNPTSPLSPTNGSHEASPLLSTGNHREHLTHCEADPKTRGVVWGVLTTVFVVTLLVLVNFPDWVGECFYPWLGLPKDPMMAALVILDRAPVIVCCLPILVCLHHPNALFSFSRTVILVCCGGVLCVLR